MANQTNLTATDLKIMIINALHEIGVPANLKGYLYLQEALSIATMDRTTIFNMTNAIYTPVAAQFDTTASRVRRSIRLAIEVAWDRGDLDTLQRFFGYTVSNTKGKPTNGEFIALLAEYLRFQMETSRTLPLWAEEGLPCWTKLLAEK